MDFKLAQLTDDPYLAPYREMISGRIHSAEALEQRLTNGKCSLVDFSSGEIIPYDGSTFIVGSAEHI